MEMAGHEILYAIISSVVIGVLSGALGAYVAIKVLTNEIKWINRILDKHDMEIDRLHDRFSNHINVHHSGSHNET